MSFGKNYISSEKLIYENQIRKTFAYMPLRVRFLDDNYIVKSFEVVASRR